MVLKIAMVRKKAKGCYEKNSMRNKYRTSHLSSGTNPSHLQQIIISFENSIWNKNI
jgi:hypothetical protein